MAKKDFNDYMNVHEVINALPFDGAVAFMRVIKARYGKYEPVMEMTPFGRQHATAVSVQTGINSFEQVHWGKFAVKGVDGDLETGYGRSDLGYFFKIGGLVHKKHIGVVRELAEATRAELKRTSIYRGKAFKLRTDRDGDLHLGAPPEFLDTTKVSEGDLFFRDSVNEAIATNLFTPVEHTEACRRYGVPLKRGVLLEGKYGTGKTLTAFITAQKCERNGWTFILVDRVSALKTALDFANLYAPAVVFAEDIDRAAAGDERTVGIDDILNMVDGVESKGREVITILTSNHVGNLNKAILRPGRLDAIISVHPPDAAAVEKLLRSYSRGILSSQANLTEAARYLDGQIPAVIREVVERAKLTKIRESRGQPFALHGEDFIRAAESMKSHLELMDPAPIISEEPTLHERVGQAISDVVKDSLVGNGLYSKTTEIEDKVRQIHRNVC